MGKSNPKNSSKKLEIVLEAISAHDWRWLFMDPWNPIQNYPLKTDDYDKEHGVKIARWYKSNQYVRAEYDKSFAKRLQKGIDWLQSWLKHRKIGGKK